MVISNLKIGTSYFFIPLKEFAKENIRYLKENLDFAMGPVNYYDFAKDKVLDEYPKIAFRKRREFSYQREFRFLLRKKDAVNEYVTLEVGDLSDIAQSCKSADLSGMLEINAG